MGDDEIMLNYESEFDRVNTTKIVRHTVVFGSFTAKGISSWTRLDEVKGGEKLFINLCANSVETLLFGLEMAGIPKQVLALHTGDISQAVATAIRDHWSR